MATDVETLSLLLEVQSNRFENQLKRQNAQAYRIFKSLEDRASNMEANVSGSFDRLARIVGGAAVLNELKKLADTWQEATNKIRSAGVGEAMAGAVANEIADIAQRSRTGFAEVADLYARLTRTGKDFGATQGEIATATETVSKALKVSGASAAETQSTLVQLGQALGSGRLQGDELRSLLENAPVVAQAIAKEFGVAIGALKDLGAEGKLTSDRVFRAIVNAQPEVAAAFAKTNASISDSFTLLQNAALKFVGNSRQMGLAAQAASTSIQFLAKNMDGVATAAAAVGAVVAARLVAQGLAPMVATIGAAVTASTAASTAIAAIGVRAQLAATSVAALRGALALVGGPVGAAILGTAAVVAYLATEASKGKESTDAYAEALKQLRPAADKATEGIKQVGETIAETSKRMREAAADEFRKKITVTTTDLDNMRTTLRGTIDHLEKFGAVGLKEDDKKRALEFLRTGLSDNAEAAVRAADELKRLGEVNPSFANALGGLDALVQRIGVAIQATGNLRSALAGVTTTNKAKDEQDALNRSGFIGSDTSKLPDPAASVAKDPLVAAMKLQQQVREAQLDKDTKALKDKTKELWSTAMEGGSPVSMKQAEAAAKAILAAEAAQKGGGGGGGKTEAETAEARLDRYTDSLARQNLVLQAEIENFGKSNAQKQAAIELAKAGVDLNRLDSTTREEILAKLNKEIELSEQLRVKKKELEDGQKAANDAAKFLGQASVDALTDIIIEGGKASDVLKNLVKQLAKAAIQAMLLGTGPLGGLLGGGKGLLGGMFPSLKFADGGWVSGPGTSRSDSVPARLSRGEFVVNAASAKKHAALLAAINTGKPIKMADGGFAGIAPLVTPKVPAGVSRDEAASKPSVTIVQHIAANGDRTVADIARRAAAEGISQYDRSLPSRIGNINKRTA